MDTTAHDLKLLSIGYFVQGGIGVFYGVAITCYVAFFGVVLTTVLRRAQGGPQLEAPAALLPVIAGIFLALALVTLAMGLCMLYAGMSLRQRKHRTLILIMAGLNCMAIPYGTVLGIFTILVMQRPAARELFGVVNVPLPAPLPRS